MRGKRVGEGEDMKGKEAEGRMMGGGGRKNQGGRL
jgi:hypothetical protein